MKRWTGLEVGNFEVARKLSTRVAPNSMAAKSTRLRIETERVCSSPLLKRYEIEEEKPNKNGAQKEMP
jgi:hypothetical protein